MYYIVRIRWVGESETHSIEQRADYRSALARFHNIIAADVGTETVTYCATFLFNEEMNFVTSPFFYSTETDLIGDPHAGFEYIVGRVYISNETLRTSIEYKNKDEAYKRYFNILAADLQDDTISYNGAFILNSTGQRIESRAFTRPAPEPEPEPEQEPQEG